MNGSAWWTDDAIEASGDDFLGRLPFAQRLAALIAQIGSSSTSSTVIGVTGPWGSGKTSTVNLALAELDDDVWLTERLNPWALSGPDAVTSEVFNAIAAALPTGSAGKRIREKVFKYGRYATTAATALVPGGSVVGDMMTTAMDRVEEERQSLTRLAAEAAEQLAQMDSRVLLFIDDIDRLQPDELLATFRAIRVLGRLPNVHYLLAYDQTTLLDVLASTTLANGKESRALAYLEKMVTVRLEQPPTRSSQIEELLQVGLDSALSGLGVVLDDERAIRLSTERENLFHEVLKEPRKVTRFLAQVHGYVPLVAISDIDVVDFLVLSLVRLCYPRLYQALSDDRTLLTGSRVRAADPILAYGGDNFDEVERDLARWRSGERVRETLGLTKSAEDERIRHALQRAIIRMFPFVLEDTVGVDREYPERRRHRRASEADLVDRYFDLNAAAEVFPDAALLGALREWAGTQEPSEVGTRLLSALGVNPTDKGQDAARLLRRMRAAVDDLSARESASAFIIGLDNLAHSQSTGSTRVASASLLAALLVRSEDKSVDVAGLVKALEVSLESSLHAHSDADRWKYIAVLTALRRSEWSPDYYAQLPVIDSVAKVLTDTSWEVFEYDLRRGDAAPRKSAGHAFGWLGYALGEAEMDRRLGLLVADGVGVDAIAARFVRQGTDPASGVRSIVDFDVASFVKRIGLAHVASARAALEDAAVGGSGDEDDVTWANLRAFASNDLLTVLSTLPAQRAKIPTIERVDAPGMFAVSNFVPTGGNSEPDVTFAAGFEFTHDAAEITEELDEAAEQVFVDMIAKSSLQGWLESAGPAWHLDAISGWELTDTATGRWVEATCTATSAGGNSTSRPLSLARARLQVLSTSPLALQVSVSVGIYMKDRDQGRVPAAGAWSSKPWPAALTLREAVDVLEAVQRTRAVARRMWTEVAPQVPIPARSRTQIFMHCNDGMRAAIDLSETERVGDTIHPAFDSTFATERFEVAGQDTWQQSPDDRTVAVALLAEWARAEGHRRLESAFDFETLPLPANGS